MDTAYFLQQLINGVTLGSVYGLIAIGYTMVYGIIGMINFAHGDIFMVGAFIALISFILFLFKKFLYTIKHYLFKNLNTNPIITIHIHQQINFIPNF